MTKEERIRDFWKVLEDNYNVTLDASVGLITRNDKLIKYLENDGFFTAPASTKYHGAYEGGLYDHSKAVTERLLWLTDRLDLKWDRTISPFIVGMFHDLCKCDQYAVTGEENGKILYAYNNKLLIKGHGAKSVMILSQFMSLTEQEMLAIRYHMGPYETEDWESYDLAIRKYDTTLWANAADMAASKVDGL